MGGSLMQMLQQYGQQFQGGGGGNFGGALGLPNGGAPVQLRGGGGGYAQPMRRYDPDFGDPRRGQGLGGPLGGGGNNGGGGMLGATSPFEVGGDSGGRPISADNGYGGAQLPGGIGWMPPGQGAGGGGGIGAGQMGGDQRRAYWDRGMNDTGRGGGARPGPVGGYWQRPMGRGPMPGQGVPLGGGGREMPNPGGVPQTQGGMIKSANPQGQSQVYNPQGGGPVSLTPAQPQQQVRRVTRDDPQARGWSGY